MVVTGDIIGQGGFSYVYELMTAAQPSQKNVMLYTRKDSIGSSTANTELSCDTEANLTKSQCLSLEEIQRTPSDKFVVKKLRQDLTQSSHEKAIESLENEAAILSNLFHPHIVSFQSYNESPDDAKSSSLIIERTETDLKHKRFRWKLNQTDLMRNKALDKTLAEEMERDLLLTRLRVAYEIIDALVYLHMHK